MGHGPDLESCSPGWTPLTIGHFTNSVQKYGESLRLQHIYDVVSHAPGRADPNVYHPSGEKLKIGSGHGLCER